MWQDAVSGAFSTLSGFMLWNNVRMLYKHKKVKGMSILTVCFFTTWGFWNLYYFPFLKQWWTFAGGFVILSANVVWVYLSLRYRKNV